MKRPDPEALHRKTQTFLAAVQDIRTAALREHKALDAVNPQTGAYIYSEDERATKHADRCGCRRGDGIPLRRCRVESRPVHA